MPNHVNFMCCLIYLFPLINLADSELFLFPNKSGGGCGDVSGTAGETGKKDAHPQLWGYGVWAA